MHPDPPTPYHTLSVNQVSTHTKTDIDDGLTPQEAAQRLSLYGFNELSGQGNVSVFSVLYRQIVNALTLVLVIAMIISFVFKDYVEGGVIAFVVVTNTIIGFSQEYSAEKTMESLRRMASPTTRVIRGDSLISVPTRDIVIGDIIVFEEGDVIGADARLFEVFNLEVDEALLTGESLPVAKSIDVIQEHDKPLGDRINMVFSSTTVTKGRGKGIVVDTGMKTEIGKIAKSLASTSVVTRTPLQKKMEILAYALFGLAIILAVIVFGVNKWKINDEVAIYAISLGISVIPEGLVAVITLTMAVGVQQMAKNYAIVRKLNALEALGSVTNICSDKTGTLTQSKMIATDAWLPGDGFYRISGRNGFSPEGKIYRSGTNITSGIEVEEEEEVTPDNMRYAFTRLVQASALCNMAVIKKGKNESNDEWHAIGDPTESALQVFAHKAGLPKPVLTTEPFKFELVHEYAFDTELKRMSVVCKEKSTDVYYVFLKGATESVLRQCTKIQLGETEANLDHEKFEPELYNELEKLASKGMRVLSLAYRRVIKTDVEISKWTREKADADMTFLGLVGIYDPPRPESKAAIQRCFGAGIEVHMLTGDHPTTAAAIAKEIGILPLLWSPELENEGKFNSQLVMTAVQFDALSEEEVDKLRELPKVIARCSPDTKVKMIDALHRRNKYVAMTGDGVNDSPSLKKADVGIAMGLGGSDVAKQASDIVLSDDNFATIVNAISEGRRIFNNIQKFILHLLSGNAGEIVTLIIGLSFFDRDGISINPMSPLQILFLNMVTSSPPAMGLGIERASNDIMRYPPRSKGLFTWEVIIDMIYYGIVLGGLSLANFVIVIYAIGNGDLGQNCNSSPFGNECAPNDPTCDQAALEIACNQIYRARATTFATLTYTLLIHSYNCRSLRDPIWTMKLYDNKVLFWSVFGGLLTAIPTFYIPGLNSQVFKQLGIGYEWGLIVGAVIIFEIFVEVYKLIKRRYLKPLEIVEGEGFKRQYSLNEYP